MESLYQTSMTLTFEEYQKQFWTLNHSRVVATVLFIWAIFIMLSVLLQNWLYAAFCVAVPFLEYFPKQRALKKIYYSNQLAVNAEVKYEFYDSYVVKQSKAGEQKVEYDKLYQIIETKTRFYLMLGKNQGYILVKENFPDGLEVFLQNLRAKAKK